MNLVFTDVAWGFMVIEKINNGDPFRGRIKWKVGL
jgi:hypothetical protein